MKKMLLCLLAFVFAVTAWEAGAKPLASSVTIELNNLTDKDDVSDLVKKLEQEAVYKAAACGPANIVEATTKIDCVKGNSGLMSFLNKNAPRTVMWSIVSLREKRCLAGCTLMHCPPPSGPVVCCNTSTYKPC